MDKKKILFICTNNSARSQMAEALLNHEYGNRYEAQSAGTHPTQVNPYAIVVMDEIGIDISHNRSKSINEFKGRTFDTVVTVCNRAREACPFFPGAGKVIHKSFQDPAKKKGSHSEIASAFRNARDQIRVWIKEELVTMDNQNGFNITLSRNGS